MKLLKKTLCLAFAGIIALGFTACEEADKGKDGKVEISLQKTEIETAFVSNGSFELPITMKGISEMPAAQDFSLDGTMGNADIRFDWDTTPESETDDMGDFAKLTVSKVSQGENADSYILTVEYNCEGHMESVYREMTLYYKGETGTSNESFNFRCAPMAQCTAALPVQKFDRDNSDPEIFINVESAYKELGINPKDVHTVNGRYAIYAGIYGDDELNLEEQDAWDDYDNAFLGVGYHNDEASVTVMGISNLKPDSVHFAQLILALGNDQYAAIHVPILVE